MLNKAWSLKAQCILFNINPACSWVFQTAEDWCWFPVCRIQSPILNQEILQGTWAHSHGWTMLASNDMWARQLSKVEINLSKTLLKLSCFLSSLSLTQTFCTAFLSLFFVFIPSCFPILSVSTRENPIIGEWLNMQKWSLITQNEYVAKYRAEQHARSAFTSSMAPSRVCGWCSCALLVVHYAVRTWNLNGKESLSNSTINQDRI